MAARASGSGESLTGMLQAWARGDLEARDRLLPIVYGELRRQAARQLRGERAGHTLQPMALVHEVYLRLAQPRRVPWESRAEFFADAAQAMRRILGRPCPQARRRQACGQLDPRGAAAVHYRRIAGMISCGTIWSRKRPQMPPCR